MAAHHPEPALAVEVRPEQNLRKDQVDASKPLPVCRWCTTEHTGEWCPVVKSIRYRTNGSIKKVEFITPDARKAAPLAPETGGASASEYPRYKPAGSQ